MSTKQTSEKIVFISNDFGEKTILIAKGTKIKFENLFSLHLDSLVCLK